MGDSQRWYDETDDFVSHLNKRNDIDLSLIHIYYRYKLHLPHKAKKASHYDLHRFPHPSQRIRPKHKPPGGNRIHVLYWLSLIHICRMMSTLIFFRLSVSFR